jgi:hypothetical protein
MQKSQTKISFYEKNYVERQINLTSPIYTVWQNSPIYEKKKHYDLKLFLAVCPKADFGYMAVYRLQFVR